jgi:hypothetical protein
MSVAPAVVTADLALRLVVPGSASLPVACTLIYDPVDPYAVRVGFRTGGSDVVEWTFARQLLSDGVQGPSGEGDVRVWPKDGPGSLLVCLSLCSPSGHALFEVPLPELVEFLTRSYHVVPTGEESSRVDLDVELALLTWTGAE